VDGKILVHVFSIPVCHHPYFMIIKIYQLNICVTIHIILKATTEIRQKQRSLQRSNLPGNNDSDYKYVFKEKIT
jgi:hypothetical protein